MAHVPLYKTMLGQMAYTSVRIETATSDGATNGCGTGFVFQFEVSGLKVPLIITARHVVQDAELICLQLHEAEEGNRHKPGPGRKVTSRGGPPAVFMHPDPSVDLAAIQLLHFTTIARGEGWIPFYSFLPRDVVPEADFVAELEAVEDVYMAGYPAGIYDAHNNLPIIRRGITATPAALDYEGRTEFLVDMAVYKGSSGSPIFINKVSQFVDADGHLVSNASMRLLGVLYGGHHIADTGEIVADGEAEPSTVSVHQMINIGVCLRAEAILDFEPILQALPITRAPWETPA